MVKRSRQDIEKTPAKQGPDEVIPEPNKIGASTPYDLGDILLYLAKSMKTVLAAHQAAEFAGTKRHS